MKKKTASKAKKKAAVKDLPLKAGHAQSVKGGVTMADSYRPAVRPGIRLADQYMPKI
jgi:hypothetical protein